FYMHLLLHVPPPATTLMALVTKSLIELRSTLNLTEKVDLIGDSPDGKKIILEDVVAGGGTCNKRCMYNAVVAAVDG
ncbi:hypothetical protein VP01_10410g1, partial [Puccinia sorghi]